MLYASKTSPCDWKNQEKLCLRFWNFIYLQKLICTLTIQSTSPSLECGFQLFLQQSLANNHRSRHKHSLICRTFLIHFRGSNKKVYVNILPKISHLRHMKIVHEQFVSKSKYVSTKCILIKIIILYFCVQLWLCEFLILHTTYLCFVA